MKTLNCLNCNKPLTKIQITKKNKCCCKGCATSYRQKAHDPNPFTFKNKDLTYYILGLIWSDGNLNKECDKITLAFKDKEFVGRLHDILCDTEKHKVYSYKKGEYLSYGIINTNKDFIKGCQQLGLVPNKSKTITFPNIPKKYYYSFIRGIFDGDGSVYVSSKYKDTTYLGASILSANKSFLIPIKQELESNNIECNLLLDWRGSVYSIKIYKKQSIINFYKYIYQNSEYFLERKKNVFIINDIV